ncbi:hypothetical protein SD72_16180 [Leucobacter komagatae]|uniref:Uncharacterized protein n=1 Tax=Leucobacter komagatae TaxID=55969 RepID=A0A0D0H2D6_9MICO|nr:hypothetical protein SD72_16180 [Leucobacter komagatae]
METTLNALTGANEQFLTGAALTAVGGPGAKHGIQLLTSSEVLDLGTLNSVEQAVLRKWVNTKDVYPYAVVLPDEPDSIIYLAKPTQPAASTADPVSGVPFPAGMPRIQSHLMHFKTLLEDNTTDRKERRPWWTLHRARETVIGNASADEHGWAPFCLTTRWGGGGKLVVGLAPGGSAPASGLHVLRPEGDLVPPAYLAALYNSDLYQEIALSLPPGQLRQADLERIGLPLLQADAVESVSKSVYELARLVTTLVRQESLRFPRVLETLRSDVTLSADLKSSWLSETGASSLWGKLQEATWATTEAKRAAGTPLGDVSFSDDLLGQVVTIHVRNEPQKTAAEIHLAGHVTVAASEALAAAIRGLAFLGGKVRDLGELYVPIDPEVLSQQKAEDDSRLDALLEQYKTERTKIEEALGQHVRR